MSQQNDADDYAGLPKEDDTFEGAFAPPVRQIGRHVFYPVRGNRYCGECGAGGLHPIHLAEEEGKAS